MLQCWIWDTIGQAGKNYETRCNLEKTGSIWKYNGDILSKNRHSFVWFLAFLKKKWGNLINFKKGMEEWVRVRFFKGGLSSSNSCNNSCMHDSALFKNCKRFCYFLFIFQHLFFFLSCSGLFWKKLHPYFQFLQYTLLIPFLTYFLLFLHSAIIFLLRFCYIFEKKLFFTSSINISLLICNSK